VSTFVEPKKLDLPGQYLDGVQFFDSPINAKSTSSLTVSAHTHDMWLFDFIFVAVENSDNQVFVNDGKTGVEENPSGSHVSEMKIEG